VETSQIGLSSCANVRNILVVKGDVMWWRTGGKRQGGWHTKSIQPFCGEM